MNDLCGQTIRGYELREQIGVGAFGVIYRARQPVVDREVAIKIILPEHASHPDFIRRFEVEAQLVAQLEHLHIVPLYDYWRDPQGAYLVMRLMKGGTLEQKLQHGPVSLPQTDRWLEQIGSALAAAHRQGVIHRDLKPANILLDEEGNAYLSDFGIAKSVGVQAHATATGAIIGTPAYLSPEQVQGHANTPQTDIYSLGVMLFEMLTGQHPFRGSSSGELLVKHLTVPLPPLQQVRPDLPAELDRVIQCATAKDPAARYADVTALVADFRRALAPEAAPTPTRPIAEQALTAPNPYKGLRAFQEADALDFFGREALTAHLLARLAPSPSQGEGDSRFLAVVGPSGSGKSSVVKAGVLPALRRGAWPGSEQWFVVEMLPGPHPLEELEIGLLRIAAHQPGGLMEQLRRDERGLARAARLVLPSADSTLLLIVDQFEEAFTLIEDKAEAKHFLDSLYAAVTDPRSPVRVILTLRADFYDRPLMHPDFSELMRQHTEVVVPLTTDELARAIAGPAERVGARLEPGLVTDIVADIKEQPGALPLLQYALTELFERREGRLLTKTAYRAIGGVMGALGRRAEEVYAALDPPSQDAARQLFLRLVTLGEGVEDTRRRVLRAELISLTPQPAGGEGVRLLSGVMDAVIERFGKARLLSFDRDPTTRGPTVEVAHEALLREWKRLREWLDASRADVRLLRLLAAAAAEWVNAERDASFLLQGARLAQFEGWAAGTQLAFTQDERAFLDASLAERQAREAAEEARRRHELETAQKLAETEKRRAEEQTRAAGQLRQGAMGLAGALVIAAILAIVAFLASQQASQSAVVARTEAHTRATAEAVAVQERQNALRQAAILLASQAETELANGYHDRAVLLALEALDKYPYTSQAEHALGQAVSYNRALQQYTAHQSAVTSVAWSPDGKRVASSSSSDNNVHIWDPATGKTLLVIEMPRGITGNKLDMALNVQWTPDGKRLLTVTGDRYTLGSQDYDVLLWEADTGKLISSVEIANQAKPESGELGVTFVNYATNAAAEIAPQSGRLATLGGDNTAILWDAAWQKPALVLSGHAKGVNSVDWSPDESKLATASLDGTARIWDARTGEVLHVLQGHQGRVNLAFWSPDGSQLATAGEDGIVRIWDAARGELVRSIPTNMGTVWSLAWTPNGKRFVTGHGDGSLRIWEAESGKLLETLRGHQGIVSDLKWSPAEGDRLASGDGSGFARIWNAAPSTAWRLYPPQAARGGDWTVQGASWSSDGRFLTMAGGDVVGATEPPAFFLWDVQANKLTMENLGDKLNYRGLEAHFSPDDKAILYLGLTLFPDFSGLATAYVFDAQSGEIIRTFTPGGENLIRSAAWSPDGSQVATGLFNNQIMIWDYQIGKQITRLVHSKNEAMFINYVEWSPDGTKIASASDESTAQVWDAHTWEPLYALQHQPPAFVLTAGWSPNGKRLLTTAGNDEQGAKDNTARIWDSATGKELLVIAGHTKSVWPSPPVIFGGSVI